jgi:hypothetical protein
MTAQRAICAWYSQNETVERNGDVCTESVSWEINDVVDIASLARGSWRAVASPKDCCSVAESQRARVVAAGTYHTILGLVSAWIDKGWC